MKRILNPLLFSVLLFLSSCEAIKGIFKAGVYTGIIVVVIIVAIVIWIIAKISGGNK